MNVSSEILIIHSLNINFTRFVPCQDKLDTIIHETSYVWKSGSYPVLACKIPLNYKFFVKFHYQPSPNLLKSFIPVPYEYISLNEGLDEEGEGGGGAEDWYGPDGLAEDGMDGMAGLGGLACPYCPKTFASNWHLKRHVLTHTKESRFKCDVCGKDFSRNDNLKSHLKSIHGIIVPSKPKPSST